MTSFEHVFVPRRSNLTIRTSEDSVWFTGPPEAVIKRAKLLANLEEAHLVVSFMDSTIHDGLTTGIGFKLFFTFHPICV